MSLHKSYLYMAAKTIHFLNGESLEKYGHAIGVTIPEIYNVLNNKYGTSATIDLVSHPEKVSNCPVI